MPHALLLRWIAADRFSKLNLTFARKLELYVYEALQEPPGQHWAEEIAHLRELNRIRNKLAHQLPSKPGHHADVKKWGARGLTEAAADRLRDMIRSEGFSGNIMRSLLYTLPRELSALASGHRLRS